MVMNFIATHTDFIYDGRFKEAIIVDGNECKKTYTIPVMHENDFPSHYTKLHDSYAELSRLNYIYKCLRSYWGKYVGFMQYKRMFNVLEENIISILDNHGVILPKPVTQSRDIIGAYGRYHCKDDIILATDIINEKFPEMKADDIMHQKTLYPHNAFIMKSGMFEKYCEFIFSVFQEFDRRMCWNDINDWKASGRQKKTHGFLGERISNVFYHHHFKHPYIATM